MTGNILLGSSLFASASLVERLQDESSTQSLTQNQSEIDQMVAGASAQLSNWRNMASMMVGGVWDIIWGRLLL